MVARVDGVCIANQKGNIFYWTSLLGGVKRSSLQAVVTGALANNSVSYHCPQTGYVLHITRGGLCWLLTTPCSSLSVREQLSLVQTLQWLHDAVQTTLAGAAGGSAAQQDTGGARLAKNITTIHQIVLEVMASGVVQVQPLPRILSQLSLRQPAHQPTNSLFGVVRLPGSMAQYGGPVKLDTAAQHPGMCLDVVERVHGSGVLSRGGAVTELVGEVLGTVTLKCPHQLLNRAICATFNKHIPSTATAAGSAHVVSCGGSVSWDGRSARCRALDRPSSCLLQYALSPTLPCSLSVTCAPVLHSNSDCEIVASLQGILSCEVTAPQLTVRLSLPGSTSTVSTRHTGHSQQTLQYSTSEDQPTVTWTLNSFPGDGQAKAFIRVVGCGRECSVSRATLDYEVSQWLCSQLKVERLTVDPPLPSSPWVRYLTVGERISLTIPSNTS